MANISINSSRQYLDNNGNPEALNSRIVPEYSSLMDFVQNAIKKLEAEKKQKETHDKEMKAKEERAKNKSSGLAGSIIQKVKDDMEKKRTIKNIISVKKAIEEFRAKKSSEEFRQKTNEFAKISRNEAMKDNKNFIIDDDGMPKILVQPGDTLSSIIRRQSPSISSWEMLKRIDEIVKLNKLKDKDLIRPGEKLKVPESILPDVTDTLNEWMREHAKDPEIANPFYFIERVKTGGKWDFKSNPNYSSNKYKHYIYNNEIINYDDIGNIHYGYVCQAAPWSSEDLVYFGAGTYQNWTDYNAEKDLSQKNQSFPSYGDNTNDFYAIYKGVEKYYQDLYANMEDDSVPKTAEELKLRPYTPDEERERKKAVFKVLKEEYENRKREELKGSFDSDDDVVLSN
ncbi:MAG: LysM peptidoglycan-binding domain-containing protein [Spirochaetales bacterium]|nr:LysM peptidoglycan-binding domain-containing protein [Spirochaetales bacterium]